MVSENSIARDFIKSCKPNPNLNAYILGGHAYRLSVHTQQTRAFELVTALLQENEIEKGMQVAVVGAGFAGVTIAAALASKGMDVELIEARHDLLPIHSRTEQGF